MGARIEGKNIVREFKVAGERIVALNGINIEIQEGSFVILKGRSGSGKTTLINILGGLDEPTKGEVFIDEKEITALSETGRDDFRRKSVGFVFQSVALISAMTAFENVDFALRIAGYPQKERENRAKECLEAVGLSERIYHKPSELSGGEQQRVAVARAIAHKPKIIFADEPTAELDAEKSFQIVELLKRVSKELKITVVMTTHDPNLLFAADNVYTLEDGEIIDVR
ncbi:MAG: ABC transporter ATP-binding protein [Oscillospiraceae bacterium]|nr:ABC transporter ATP-binding protein [Oscillospiraceae bacterium]